MNLSEVLIIIMMMRKIKMLETQLYEQLKTLKLQGILDALEEQENDPTYENMPFEDRFAHCVDKQVIYQENKRLTGRLRRAKLYLAASMEDIDYRKTREIKKTEITALAKGKWIKDAKNITITGFTGTGKSYLACALVHKASLLGYQGYYVRMGRLFEQLQLARVNGTYMKLLMSFSKIKVLILDDFGTHTFNSQSRKDLLELLDDRYGKLSTIVTSQFPVKEWYTLIGDKTMADAILDRLVHNAHRIALKGDSLRKIYAQK